MTCVKPALVGRVHFAVACASPHQRYCHSLCGARARVLCGGAAEEARYGRRPRGAPAGGRAQPRAAPN